MTDKKIGPAPAGTEDTVRTHELLSIVPRKLTNRQRVELVRQAFPDKYEGFGEPEASKGRHTEYTGLQYADEIETLINASESRRSDFRVLNNKLTVRCDDALYRRLQQAKKAFGEDCTNQEFILSAILHECERIEGKRRSADNGISF